MRESAFVKTDTNTHTHSLSLPQFFNLKKIKLLKKHEETFAQATL